MRQAECSHSAFPTHRKHHGYWAPDLDNNEDERMVVTTLMVIITNNNVEVPPLH